MAKFCASNITYHQIFMDESYNIDDLLEHISDIYISKNECNHSDLMKLILDYFETKIEQNEEKIETKVEQNKQKVKPKPIYYQLALFNDGSRIEWLT